MKYLIVTFFVFFGVKAHAQITVEHVYSDYFTYHALLEVDSGDFKYVFYNYVDTVSIYNLDHTIDRVIKLPIIKDSTGGYADKLDQISKKLFDHDDNYECLISHLSKPFSVRIYKENGDVLFGCENCKLANTSGINASSATPFSITNTDKGTKMMIDYLDTNFHPFQTVVFSLPGKLPSTCVTKSGGTNGVQMISGSSLPTSAYPNPSNGQVHIDYKLPDGVATGDIVITNIEGKEVRRFKVGNMFNDILIQNSDLPSGSYFYKVVTEKGESEAKRIIIVK
jgi:hypothetical protein